MSEYSFSNKSDYELIAEGTYEVVLETAEIKSNQTNTKDWISCKFVIRKDVEQPNGGRVVFDNIYRDKQNPTQFDHRKLQRLLLVQGPNGTYEFADDEHLVQFINGLQMQIKISLKEADDWHDDQYNEVAFCSYKPSKAKPQTLGTVPTPVKAAASVTEEEDLPF